MKKRLVFFVLLILLIFVSYTTANADEYETLTKYLDRTDSQQEYGALVSRLNKIKYGALTAASVEPVAVLCRTDGREISFDRWEPRYALSGPENCWTLVFNDEDAAKVAAKEIAQLPGISYAECDTEITACQENSVSFRSWGADKMNFGSYLDFCTEHKSSTGVTVAVIDSGVFLHNDLRSRINEVGYDYVDSDNDPTNDIFGHGTSVAGVVVDCTQKLPVYILPIRTLNAEGKGMVSDTINAIREAIGKGADIINLSLSSKVHSSAFDAAIADALSAGVCVVAAAGNDSMDASNVCPGHIDAKGIIVVGSVEADNGISSYSNYGESVDVYTYGSNIQCCSKTGGYVSKRGTSFSTPHVSALAAMIKLIHPDISPSETENRICAAADTDSVLPVPDAVSMIPVKTGLSLNILKMNPGETITVPQAALPISCSERIVYSSSDDTVAEVSGGVLHAYKEGNAIIIANCFGLENVNFSVTVGEFPGSYIKIPAGTKIIEAEAFANCGNIRFIEIPFTTESIGNNAFPDAVLLCMDGSIGAQYAQKIGADYIITGKQ